LNTRRQEPTLAFEAATEERREPELHFDVDTGLATDAYEPSLEPLPAQAEGRLAEPAFALDAGDAFSLEPLPQEEWLGAEPRVFTLDENEYGPDELPIEPQLAESDGPPRPAPAVWSARATGATQFATSATQFELPLSHDLDEPVHAPKPAPGVDEQHGAGVAEQAGRAPVPAGEPSPLSPLETGQVSPLPAGEPPPAPPLTTVHASAVLDVEPPPLPSQELKHASPVPAAEPPPLPPQESKHASPVPAAEPPPAPPLEPAHASAAARESGSLPRPEQTYADEPPFQPDVAEADSELPLWLRRWGGDLLIWGMGIAAVVLAVTGVLWFRAENRVTQDLQMVARQSTTEAHGKIETLASRALRNADAALAGGSAAGAPGALGADGAQAGATGAPSGLAVEPAAPAEAATAPTMGQGGAPVPGVAASAVVPGVPGAQAGPTPAPVTPLVPAGAGTMADTEARAGVGAPPNATSKGIGADKPGRVIRKATKAARKKGKAAVRGPGRAAQAKARKKKPVAAAGARSARDSCRTGELARNCARQVRD
jgi:hypothetical protein